MFLLLLSFNFSLAQVSVAWSNFPSGVAVALDASDNVYTAYWEYNPAGDISVVKRNSAGSILWEVIYNNTNNTRHEVATWVETDSQGNVLVSGTIRSGYSNPVNVNSILMKFSPSGTLLWRVVYENDFDGSSTRKCLIDSNDNIYVLGIGTGPNGQVARVKKFNASGVPLMDYFDAGYGAPINFKFTPDNNLIIVHRTITGIINSYSKISLTGAFLWNSGGITSSYVGDAAGDDFGNTYIINENGLTKLNLNGSIIWSQNNSINGNRVEVGSDNNPVVCGYPVASFGVAFMKYDSNGNLLWQNLDADGSGFSLLAHAQMKLDSQNAAYLAGGTMSEMAICKVNTNGTTAWTIATSSGYPTDFDFGSDNSVYVTGGTTAKINQDALAVTNFEPSNFVLQIAPNPCENLLELQGINDFKSFKITDVSGRVFKENSIINHQIDVSELPKGVYVVVVTAINDAMYQTKFVKK